MKTTFELVGANGELVESVRFLDDEVNMVRDKYTRVLGGSHGRVMLKAQASKFATEVVRLEAEVDAHKKEVTDQLAKEITSSVEAVVQYFLPLVKEKLADRYPTEEKMKAWLNFQLHRKIPKASALGKQNEAERALQGHDHRDAK